METTRLSTKGQIVLPQSVRLAHAWVPGTEFTVEETQDGVILRAARRFQESRLQDVAGCLPAGQPPKSLRRMRTAIAREVKRRRDRGRY